MYWPHSIWPTLYSKTLFLLNMVDCTICCVPGLPFSANIMMFESDRSVSWLLHKAFDTIVPRRKDVHRQLPCLGYLGKSIYLQLKALWLPRHAQMISHKYFIQLLPDDHLSKHASDLLELTHQKPNPGDFLVIHRKHYFSSTNTSFQGWITLMVARIIGYVIWFITA